MPNVMKPTTGSVVDNVLTAIKLKPIVPLTSNPFAVFNATYNGGTVGVDIEATIGSSLTAETIQLFRGSSLDQAQASMIQSWNGPFRTQQQLSFQDGAAGNTAISLHYWMQIVYSATPPVSTSLIGPQTVYLNAQVSTSSQIPAFSASVTNGPGLNDTLCVSFELPQSADFGYADILISGYNGIPSAVIVAQGTSSPFSFAVKRTGETVKLQANAVNIQGVAQLGGPTLTVTLNATSTVPAIVYDATAISLAASNQITFAPGAETNLVSYKIYRAATGGTFAGSTLIDTLPAGATNNYVFTDMVANPQNFIYFITAVSSIGTSAASPPIIPGQTYTAASQGSGATAVAVKVANGANYTVAVTFISAKGTNYYQTPLVTFSGSSLTSDATGVAVVDGAGGVKNINMVTGGTYASADTVTVSIHY